MDRQVWGQLLHLANQKYSIAPRDFWKLSIWEWRHLLGQNPSAHASHTDFEILAARYPDQTIED